MKKIIFGLLLFSHFMAIAQQKPLDGTLKLWYNDPAKNWNEALPIGNGRLGAMVFGGTNREQLQLNEETVWSGGPNNNVTAESGKAIPAIRKLLAEGKIIEAQALDDDELM